MSILTDARYYKFLGKILLKYWPKNSLKYHSESLSLIMHNLFA